MTVQLPCRALSFLTVSCTNCTFSPLSLIRHVPIPASALAKDKERLVPFVRHDQSGPLPPRATAARTSAASGVVGVSHECAVYPPSPLLRSRRNVVSEHPAAAGVVES